ncbi:MAG: hypothetical protein HYX75_12760, partial [Acidobacteria bacterium]|nr:hypothetical protein [Acidobacteriota bacterium]
MTTHTTPYQAPKDICRLLKVLAGIGAAIIVAGVFIDPHRTWPNFLIASYYLLSLGLAGLFFIAVQYVGKGVWSTVFRRVPEAMTSVLVPVGALLLLAVGLGAHTMYEWTHHEAIAQSHVLQAKTGWLSLPFFLARSVLYLLIWIGFARAIVSNSRRQDEDGSLEHTVKNTRNSAIFLVAFAITFAVATFDWIMSVQPHWFSTIFGLYNFAGLFVNGLATMSILVIVLRRSGAFRGIINDQHLHDLGKYVFAFTTFWAYLWFSQYMLVWYANLPEEVTFFQKQTTGGWLSLFILNFGLNWVIPFLTLMPRAAKRSEGVMLKVCTVLMIGHWLDLYLMVIPSYG